MIFFLYLHELSKSALIFILIYSPSRHGMYRIRRIMHDRRKRAHMSPDFDP